MMVWLSTYMYNYGYMYDAGLVKYIFVCNDGLAKYILYV
jgi:hypothetical protein